MTTPEQTAEAGLLDINTASATELESLPGIGPVLAGRIVAHREANGPFARTDGLLAVDGIGPALLSAVRPSVAVLSVGEGNPYGHPTAAALDASAHGSLRSTFTAPTAMAAWNWPPTGRVGGPGPSIDKPRGPS